MEKVMCALWSDRSGDALREQLLRDLESRASAAALQESIDAMREQYEVRK